MTRPKTVAQLLLFACLAVLAACGGSGSSGFDITPLAENAVIEEALATGQCADSGALHICPATSNIPSSPGTPAPTPGGAEVQLDTPGTDALSCGDAAGAAACTLRVSFVAGGLPADAIYRIAARDLDDGGEWIVGERVAAQGGGFSADVPLPAGGRFRIAVLVFAAGRDTVRGRVLTLGETGAIFAFVAPELTVTPPQ